ncbi:sulfotransferase [Spirosoma sp.]|uniref:sulfotransferase n=1 Tax=Spirosoma sp. TaxID=1899569 RepID=UPI00263757E6|nr:sulfotransferase [Spirosoma sp.]MCX6216656.1 sulfotransferase [Spirosoma sp.]
MSSGTEHVIPADSSDSFVYPVIAVGSLGGSGTRVIAQLLNMLGIFMGDNLNQSNDNLLFTLLFKDPLWFASATWSQIQYRFMLFEKITKGHKLNRSELVNSIKVFLRSKHISVAMGLRIIFSNQFKLAPGRTNTWGWKEPNTQLFIEHLPRCFTALKYIQVVRHGLDMAYSSNRQQLQNWGYLFGLSNSDESTESSVLQLEYWIRSNKYVIEQGRQLLGDDFYLLNYDRLCQYPEQELRALVAFLGITPSPELWQKLIDQIQISPSTNRYRQHDLSVFSNEQLNYVQSLGFSIEH